MTVEEDDTQGQYDEHTEGEISNISGNESDSLTESTRSFHTALTMESGDSVTASPAKQGHTLVRESKHGLMNIKAMMFLCLWYLFSAGTLFSNKYILSSLHSNPTMLGCSQILMTSLCGFIQLHMCTTSKKRTASSRKFIFGMFQLGLMRLVTVVLGLVALKYVTVSFTETVKSSAPIFTVIIAKFILNESTPWLVMGSLLPIMLGLALTSAYDLSFNVIGFLAALTNNLADCLQNVYSKLLISAKEYEILPVELQFYTSIASLVLQIPISLLLTDIAQDSRDIDQELLVILIVNGVCFHLQSFTAYSLMAFISPVTHSVSNTVKRALLIWLSILIFHNPITFLSGLGMMLVSMGVLLYNQARHYSVSVETDDSQSADSPPPARVEA